MFCISFEFSFVFQKYETMCAAPNRNACSMLCVNVSVVFLSEYISMCFVVFAFMESFITGNCFFFQSQRFCYISPPPSLSLDFYVFMISPSFFLLFLSAATTGSHILLPSLKEVQKQVLLEEWSKISLVTI